MVKFDSGYLKKSGEIISLEEIIKLNKQGKLNKHDIFCPDCKIARLKLVHKKNIFLQTSNKQIHKQYCSKITDDTKSTSIKEPNDIDSERVKYIKNKLKNLLENFRLNQVNIDSEGNEDKNLKDNDYFQNSKEVKYRNNTTPDESRHCFTNYKKKIIPKQSHDAFYFGICKIEKIVKKQDDKIDKYFLKLKHYENNMLLASLSITPIVGEYLGNKFQNHINNNELYKVSFFTNGTMADRGENIVILRSDFLNFEEYK
ncbi:TPA: hypothetical protein RZK20_001118 [Campylobacter coli]|nr:hypothetical protein BOP99_05565 [Campylobacter coli]HEB9344586.1 hypothetical protein [Campylobacter coli]HEB9349829.1 hypothetical protein [Campylobacter coli]HEH5496970.1 hypothetical protein [Campylobacter coli]